MARRQQRNRLVFASSWHLTICIPHAMEAPDCPFYCLMSRKKAVNINFYSLWFVPTGNDSEFIVSVADALFTRPLNAFFFSVLLYFVIVCNVKRYYVQITSMFKYICKLENCLSWVNQGLDKILKSMKMYQKIGAYPIAKMISIMLLILWKTTCFFLTSPSLKIWHLLRTFNTYLSIFFSFIMG